eukprot:3587926-Rhodomonas_salina.1
MKSSLQFTCHDVYAPASAQKILDAEIFGANHRSEDTFDQVVRALHSSSSLHNTPDDTDSIPPGTS